ncbi:MAG TPA: hypothetical protein GXX18_09170 [Bacillales bacterium]|nr:hypothetical protein [Bacillales bacterium]
MEWTYTGRYIPTTEALQYGLVQYEEEDPLKKAYEIAKEIVINTAATSNSFIGQLLWRMLSQNNPLSSHLAESKFLYWAGNNRDAKEDVAAFLQKREACFPLSSNDLPSFSEDKGEY